MSAQLIERAAAKINLTLRVLGRRADGYHELESLVAFCDVADTLTFDPGGALSLDIRGEFADACGPAAGNLVLKAAAAFAERIPDSAAGRFTLEKRIPVAAGLGGGSTDAAAALRLLARANGVPLEDERLLAAACAVGADVPVCVDSRPRIMRGVGEILSPPIALPKFPALLVNPGVALATKDVFAALKLSKSTDTQPGAPPGERAALLAWLREHDNDLIAPALALQPAVGEVLEALQRLPGILLARMSGSGATCFALFDTPQQAAAGAVALRAEGRGWWLHAGEIG